MCWLLLAGFFVFCANHGQTRKLREEAETAKLEDNEKIERDTRPRPAAW